MQDSQNDEPPPLVPRKHAEAEKGKALLNTYVKMQDSQKKGAHFILLEIMWFFKKQNKVFCEELVVETSQCPSTYTNIYKIKKKKDDF